MKANDCGNPESLMNSMNLKFYATFKQPEKMTAGAVSYVACKPGYRYNDGSAFKPLSCTENGWVINDPECIGNVYWFT